MKKRLFLIKNAGNQKFKRTNLDFTHSSDECKFEYDSQYTFIHNPKGYFAVKPLYSLKELFFNQWISFTLSFIYAVSFIIILLFSNVENTNIIGLGVVFILFILFLIPYKDLERVLLSELLKMQIIDKEYEYNKINRSALLHIHKITDKNFAKVISIIDNVKHPLEINVNKDVLEEYESNLQKSFLNLTNKPNIQINLI